MIGIGLWGQLYYIHGPPQNSLGNFVGPYIRSQALWSFTPRDPSLAQSAALEPIEFQGFGFDTSISSFRADRRSIGRKDVEKVHLSSLDRRNHAKVVYEDSAHLMQVKCIQPEFFYAD